MFKKLITFAAAGILLAVNSGSISASVFESSTPVPVGQFHVNAQRFSDGLGGTGAGGGSRGGAGGAGKGAAGRVQYAGTIASPKAKQYGKTFNVRIDYEWFSDSFKIHLQPVKPPKGVSDFKYRIKTSELTSKSSNNAIAAQTYEKNGHKQWVKSSKGKSFVKANPAVSDEIRWAIGHYGN